jgi:hypothetical protein
MHTNDATIARRTTKAAAKRHMLDGGTIAVSEHGHEPTLLVTPSCTTHTGGLSEWNELESGVRMWTNRYPNQRYYIVGSTS